MDTWIQCDMVQTDFVQGCVAAPVSGSVAPLRMKRRIAGVGDGCLAAICGRAIGSVDGNEDWLLGLDEDSLIGV